MQIADVMTRDVELTKPDATIADAARIMAKQDIGLLPVGENDKLVGVITDRDIAVRAVAEGLDPNTTTVDKIMSEKLLYCYQDEDVKKEAQAEEERLRKEKEARQNALPDWIAKSTVSGDITAIGAKEEQSRQGREVTAAFARNEDVGEKKMLVGRDEDVMAAYWAELAKAKEQEAADESAEEDDDDEDDEFEDVHVGGDAVGNGVMTMSGALEGETTPARLESSNATDEEHLGKKIWSPNGGMEAEKAAAVTPAASDEDELEFENI